MAPDGQCQLGLARLLPQAGLKGKSKLGELKGGGWRSAANSLMVGLYDLQSLLQPKCFSDSFF